MNSTNNSTNAENQLHKTRAESNKSLLPLLKLIATRERETPKKKSICRFHFQLLLLLWFILCKFSVLFFSLYFSFFFFFFSSCFFFTVRHNYMCLDACIVALFYFYFFFHHQLFSFCSMVRIFNSLSTVLLLVSFSQSTL